VGETGDHPAKMAVQPCRGRPSPSACGGHPAAAVRQRAAARRRPSRPGSSSSPRAQRTGSLRTLPAVIVLTPGTLLTVAVATRETELSPGSHRGAWCGRPARASSRTCGRPLSPGGSRRVRASRRRVCRSSRASAWRERLGTPASVRERARSAVRGSLYAQGRSDSAARTPAPGMRSPRTAGDDL
jgi:hypothetical protein